MHIYRFAQIDIPCRSLIGACQADRIPAGPRETAAAE